MNRAAFLKEVEISLNDFASHDDHSPEAHIELVLHLMNCHTSCMGLYKGKIDERVAEESEQIGHHNSSVVAEQAILEEALVNIFNYKNKMAYAQGMAIT